MPQISLGRIDLVVVVAYLAAIVGLGCWAGLRQRTRSDGDDYFLAGRSLSWPIVGLALFSTNISTLELISLAEEGYKNGIVYGNLELLAPITLLVLAIVFVPFYLRSGISTLPDFLEKRYSRASRQFMVVVAIASAVFIHLGFALFTGGKLLEGLFGINLTISIVAMLSLTGIYTILGGLKSVAITEAVQSIVLIFGSVITTVVVLNKLGGWNGLTSALASEPHRLTLLRSSDVEPDLAWHAVFLGYPIIGIWYWCADQTIVQRVLGAKDVKHAQVGALFTGFIKILGMFIFIVPGIAYYVLVKQGKAEPLADSALALPRLITTLLPIGLQGVVVAALLAAMMSTIAGALNSIATVFCYDVYQQWRPQASEVQMVRTGRLVTLGAILVAILWAPQIERFGGILKGNTMMICYVAPSITAVFLWGVLWRGASAAGAFATLVCGSILGLIMFLLDWNRTYTGWNVSFMMASFYLFVVSSIVLFVVSRLAPHRHPAASQLVWTNPADFLRQPAWKGLANYKILSLLLLGCVVAVYLAF
jgi:solute:Na+ symporter, SSS family